jgi:hypothetical protein
MNCDAFKNNLGQYLDNELSSEDVALFDAHLVSCDDCRAEHEALTELAEGLAANPAVDVPDSLWQSIEGRLDEAIVSPRQHGGSWRWQRTLGVAAMIAFSLGIGWLGISQFTTPAQAASVDFGILLDGVPLDAKAAFQKFVSLYHGKQVRQEFAHSYAPKLNFALPENLPGGFVLESVYLLRFGEEPGVAAAYTRDGDFLAAIFHEPVKQEDFGTHKDRLCVMGQHRGHKVEVGNWKLVHLTDATTCHCVLSTLDESTDLPLVLSAVAPESLPNTSQGHSHP